MRLNSLDKLRAQITRIEGRTSTTDISLKGNGPREKHTCSSAIWSLGTPEIDQLFARGLAPHALHEITPAHYQDSWAALSFALALLSCRTHHDQRPVLWCSSSTDNSEFGRLYGHGLQRFNLDPTRFIMVETKNDRETAYVLEEALKSRRLSGTLGLMNAPDIIPSRRLSLMAAKGQTPALLITKPGQENIRNATTRWEVAGLPLEQSAFAAFPFHQFSWLVSLTRNRQGPADKKWHLEFPSYESPINQCSRKAFRFCHPSPFRNRKAKPPEGRIKAA